MTRKITAKAWRTLPKCGEIERVSGAILEQTDILESELLHPDRWAIAPLHHPLNRFAVTGGALRRVLVDLLANLDHPSALIRYSVITLLLYKAI